MQPKFALPVTLAASAAGAAVIFFASGIDLLFSYAIAVNLSALVLMATDKLAAKRGHFRVPELALWGLAAFGGGGGILLGMRLFRHKTKKASFQFFLVLILVLQFFAINSLAHIAR